MGKKVLAVLMLVPAVMLAGCGGIQNGNGRDTGTESVGTVETAEPSTAVEEPAAEPATQTVSTIFGDIVVPVKPTRIVADDYLGSLIALGAIPVGTPGLHLQNPYFAEALAGVEDTGDYGDASVEKMIALEPDLIITATSDEQRYEQMDKIAPTVAVPYGELKNAHEEIGYFGELLGLSEQADAWLEEYDRRIADAKAKVDAVVPADATFTIFERSDKSVWTYGDNFGRGGQAIYQALGRLPKAEVADEIMEKQWKEISMEALPEYAGDYLIVTVSSSSGWTLQKFKEDPVWGSLDAVKNDRIYVWPEERSWYYDPIAVLAQTEELAAWLVP